MKTEHRTVNAPLPPRAVRRRAGARVRRERVGRQRHRPVSPRPTRSPRTPRREDEHAEAGAEHGAAAHEVRGLASAADGLRIVVEDPELRRGRAERLAFRIVDERGATVRDFDVEHTKRMHLIVARRDLTGFQHLHPEQRADGAWEVPRRAARRRLVPPVRRLLARRRAADAAADLRVDGARRPAPCRPPRRPRSPTAATTSPAAADAHPARRPSCASRSARTASRSRPRTTSARAATSSRCARATWPSCTCTRPTRRQARSVRGHVPDRGPLPPVPAVPARRPRPDRRVHAGGASDAASTSSCRSRA